MASTYVNDLRLNEMATGDASGTWGTITNTNLELIGEALGYGTQDCFTSDADATTTVADGATDPARAIYFKVTSSATLTATRTLTIAPNTVSRLQFIENATTGSQSINISQGSGANVTIGSGETKAVYLDGAGSGAAVVDSFATFSVANARFADGSNSAPSISFTSDTNTGIYRGGTDILKFVTAGTDAITIDASQDVTLAGSLNFADSEKAIFGAGSDLQIYHDGSNSKIVDGGTGNLNIQADDFNVLNAGGTETKIAASSNGPVTLYYDNSSKLATTSTGINVTGEVQADSLDIDGNGTIDGTLTITTSDNNQQLIIKSTDADANDGPIFDLVRDSASPADNDIIGSIRWRGEDSAGNETQYADIRVFINDVTDATEDGQFNLRTMLNGQLKLRLKLDPTETVINEEGENLDFRVESDTSTHALFVDAGNNVIGLGTANTSDPWSGYTPTAIGNMLMIGSSGASITYSDMVHGGYYDGSNWLQRFTDVTVSRHEMSGAPGGSAHRFYTASNVTADTATTQILNLSLAPASAVVNEDSRDIDFRVESDGNTHALFVDAGNNHVNINTSSDLGASLNMAGTAMMRGSSEGTGGAATVAATNATLSISGATGSYNSSSFGTDRATVAIRSREGSDGGWYPTINIATIRESLTTGSASTGGIGFTTIDDSNDNGVDDAGRIEVFNEINSNVTSPTKIKLWANPGGGGIGGVAALESVAFGTTEVIFNDRGGDQDFRVESDGNANMFIVNADADQVYVGKYTANTSVAGVYFSTTQSGFTREDGNVAFFNRQNTDGQIIGIGQQDITEGNISVSGSTVTFNGGHLGRWSRLLDNSKDLTIVKGTVMTNLDEMVEWGDEDNEQLNKMAVSSVEGDANVAGVFVNWDNDDDWNDMNIAMTGDMVIRIAQGTTVARGDLLMSAGDGTAKPQGDDIVRSKTIAKVTSTNVSHTYDDGTYLVPCVLMAC